MARDFSDAGNLFIFIIGIKYYDKFIGIKQV